MFTIRVGSAEELEKVKAFYDSLIEEVQNAEYKPGWKKDIYPTEEMLREALEKKELYTSVVFSSARPIIHTFGVHPGFSGRGLGTRMMEEAVKIAEGMGLKALRLDVLDGNLPAERLYEKVGFQYAGSLNIFYEDTGWADFNLYEYEISGDKESFKKLSP